MPRSPRPWVAVLAAVLLVLTTSAPVSRADDDFVMVFAAASTTDAVQGVLQRFREAHPDISVRASFAASSTLAKQIAQGAPADLYLSANVGWMDFLETRGDIAPESRLDLLGNRLVLVVPRDTPGPESLETLPGYLDDRRLAMGDPSHVPAGQYAKAALQTLGLWGGLEGRTAYGSDVRAALALVGRGEAAAGVVYATDARISDAVARAAVFPADSHPPIRYPLARVAGRNGAAVRAVYRFLRGAQARAVFRDYGFTIVDDSEG